MPVRSAPDPEGLPGIIRMDEARAAGLTADQVRQRVRAGRWCALGRGVYLRDEPRGENAFERARTAHADRAIAAAMTHAGSVIGLQSAAALYDLPTVTGHPSQVQLISRQGRAGIRDGINIHRLALTPVEVTSLAAPVTTPLRTWMDITRAGPLADSLAVGDQALRRGLLTGEDVRRVARTAVGRGCRRMRAAAPLLDAGHETALESWSAACFHHWRLPQPRAQVLIVDHGGNFVARVDFLWEDVGVVGEADGALKYQDPRSLYDEKRREDRLRALGYRVIRWGWSDLARPGALRRRLESALIGAAEFDAGRRTGDGV